MKTFSIIIVSSGERRRKLEECLRTLFAQSYSKELYEAIVVDSGSGSETIGFLQEVEKGRRNLKVVLPNRGNIGPARARNLGVGFSRADIVAFTDDDCLAPKNWLSALADGYRRYSRVAGAGGILLPVETKIRRNLLAGYEAVVYHEYRREKGFYLSRKRDELPVFTANMSYRRDVFHSLGGFRSDFPPFVYGEDGDLKERALKEGYEFLFVPAPVYHNEDYNFLNFWLKEEKRGAGILRYLVDHKGKLPSRLKIFLKLFLSPLAGGFFLRKHPRQLALSPIAVLAFAGRQWGKLKYYNMILNRGD